MIKNQLDLKMSVDVLKQDAVIKKQLPIEGDEDTSFDIFFDLYNSESEQYLYIKLVENSAVAPFYYNRSYSIEDLQKCHRIFKCDNMKQVKDDLNDLFEAGLVKLYYNKDNNGIIMELQASLFAKTYKIHLELYKEMIPENEKNDQLINLYNINKRNLKLAKEIFLFFNSYKEGVDKKIIEDLKKNFDLDGLVELNNNREEEQNIKINLDDKSELVNSGIEVKENEIKKLFIKRKRPKINNRKDNEDYSFQLELKNKTKKLWDEDYIKFKLDKNSSNLYCKNITYFFYESESGQKGVFQFFFDVKSKPGEYICFFDVFIDGVKLDNTRLELKIEIPEKE